MEKGEEQPFQDWVHPHYEKPSSPGKEIKVKQTDVWKLKKYTKKIPVYKQK